MRYVPPPVLTLINSGSDYADADLWTITLLGGAVIRWTSADRSVSVGGNTYDVGPLISHGQIIEKMGLEVAVMDMIIDAVDTDLIGGVPVIQFIKRHGLDGANVRLDRAFAADWASPWLGTILRFSGRVTSVPQVQGGNARVVVSAWTILLNTSIPTELFQASCVHTVYDTGCGLSAEAFSAGASLTAVVSRSVFDTGFTGLPGRFALGRIVFLTGPNTGVSRAVRGNDTTGRVTLISSLPAMPTVGDVFKLYPGCDLTRGTCQTLFNNLLRHKATPFVPVPETVL